MKLLHLSDLHLGRGLHGFPLAAEQRRFLSDALQYAAEHRPDAVLLAGDIYDRGVPPTEAVSLLSGFLDKLCVLRIPVLVVAGNHDSPERLQFAGGILRRQGIYIAGEPSSPVMQVTLEDETGPVRFVLLPFARPVQVKALFPDKEIVTYSDAVRALLETLPPSSDRTVLVTHQFVTSGGTLPEQSDSESAWVGGAASVDASLFDGFCYTALGHLHTTQAVGRESVRYAGAPLVYALGEAGREKFMTEVQLHPDGAVTVNLLPVTPLRAVTTVTGSFAELLTHPPCNDFAHIILTDARPVPDALPALRGVFPYAFHLSYENWRETGSVSAPSAQAVKEKSLPELFFAFAGDNYGYALEPEDEKLIAEVFAGLEAEQ